MVHPVVELWWRRRAPAVALGFPALEHRRSTLCTSPRLGSVSEHSLSTWIVVPPTSVSVLLAVPLAVLLAAVLRDEHESTDVSILAMFSYSVVFEPFMV